MVINKYSTTKPYICVTREYADFRTCFAMKAWPESKGRHGSQDRTCRREGESLWSKAKLFPKRELLLLVRTLLFVYLVMSLVPTASEAAAASTTRFRRRSYDQLLTAAAAEDDLEDRMMGDSPYTLPINFKMKFVR